jgi:hypothetical protein
MTEQCILTELSPPLLGLGGAFFDTDIPGVCGKIKWLNSVYLQSCLPLF